MIKMTGRRAWEYQIHIWWKRTIDEVTREMNEMGAEGWEFVGTDGGGGWLYFKREILDSPPPRHAAS